MLKLFCRNRNGPIGLDVGTDGLKLLQLSHSGEKLGVVAVARWQFPPSLSEPGADPATRTSLAAQAVRDMLKKGNFRGRDVVSCLRGGDLAIRNVRLPQMPERELRKALLWECQERFGFPVAPDRMYYVNTGEVRQGADVRNEILVMAVSEEAIGRHLEMLDEMTLKPVHVDAEPVALSRTYMRHLRREADESSVSVIVDVGVASSLVVVARGKTILLVKSIDVAGRTLNQSVAAELGLSYAEAAHLRKGACGDGREAEFTEGSQQTDQVQWSVFDAIRGQVETLAREISLCLRYCSVTFRGLRPDQITLAGGEAYDRGLVKLLGEYLDLPCVAGQPLLGVDLGNVDMGSGPRGSHAEWSVVAGLALRDMTETQDVRNPHHVRCRLPA